MSDSRCRMNLSRSRALRMEARRELRALKRLALADGAAAAPRLAAGVGLRRSCFFFFLFFWWPPLSLEGDAADSAWLFLAADAGAGGGTADVSGDSSGCSGRWATALAARHAASDSFSWRTSVAMAASYWRSTAAPLSARGAPPASPRAKKQMPPLR